MKPAERQRRYRERQRRGEIVVSVTIDHVEAAEALKAIGLLTEAEEDDPAAIGRALEAATIRIVGLRDA